MNKSEFLDALKAALSGLPTCDVEERLRFYAEMIEDRIEDGCTEAEAVAEIGSVDEIAEQTLAELPLVGIVKEQIKPKRRLRTWEILLLALGSPLWLSLLVAAFAVVLSLYISLWAVVISLWASFAALAAGGPAGLVAGVCFLADGAAYVGIATMAAGFLSAGLAIFLFFGCKAATKGSALLIPKTMLGLKKHFARKENAS